MDEQEIINSLKQNIPIAPEPTLPSPEAPGQFGVADVSIPIELDELTQYKVQQYFGVEYKAHDEASKEQTRYIFEKIAQDIGTQDYGFVMAKVRDMENILGIAHSENRLYKLYQWVKLDSQRRNIEAEQGALRG